VRSFLAAESIPVDDGFSSSSSKSKEPLVSVGGDEGDAGDAGDAMAAGAAGVVSGFDDGGAWGGFCFNGDVDVDGDDGDDGDDDFEGVVGFLGVCGCDLFALASPAAATMTNLLR